MCSVVSASSPAVVAMRGIGGVGWGGVLLRLRLLCCISQSIVSQCTTSHAVDAPVKSSVRGVTEGPKYMIVDRFWELWRCTAGSSACVAAGLQQVMCSKHRLEVRQQCLSGWTLPLCVAGAGVVACGGRVQARFCKKNPRNLSDEPAEY